MGKSIKKTKKEKTVNKVNKMNEFLTTKEAAKYCKVPQRTVQRWCLDGKIFSWNVGMRQTRYIIHKYEMIKAAKKRKKSFKK